MRGPQNKLLYLSVHRYFKVIFFFICDIMLQTTYDEATKTWSGLKTTPIFNPNDSVAQIILNALQRNSNKIGQVIYGQML